MKHRRLRKIPALLLLALGLSGSLSVCALAEEKPMVPAKEGGAAVTGTRLSGNLRVDLFGFEQMPSSAPAMQQAAMEPGPRKSPWLAAGMSLLVPGSGEFYAQSYWKAAAFLAIEIAAWALAYTYDKKGDKQTDSFQNFANGNWDVYKYADWTVRHATEINSSVDPKFLQGVRDEVSKTVDWAKLNQLESALGNWYSHNLPPYGEQQYYELIGKYEQFYQGWTDQTQDLPGYYDVAKANLSPNFQSYSVERGVANDYYSKASTFVAVAIVNHIVSAVDAAWSAGSYNKVHAEVGLQNVPVRGYYTQVPVVKVRYSF